MIYNELDELKKKFGFKFVKMSEIVSEVNLAGGKDKKNSLYMPKSGDFFAISSVDNLKPNVDYMQIVLKAEKVKAEYLASFFNTPIGFKIRDSVSSGANRTISKSGLLNAEVGLPDMDIQEKTINVKNDLKEIVTQLYMIQKDLESSPKKINDLAKKLNKIKEQVSEANSGTINELINKGENAGLEFKSSLRIDLKSKKDEEYIRVAVLKAIAAFFNSNGGTLLIGVSDKGEVLGMAGDYFISDDELLLYFKNLFREHIGLEHLLLLNYGLVEIDDKKILRVDCQPSTYPIWLKINGKEEFYVRSGPASDKLDGSKVVEYIKRRFQKL